MQKKTKAIICDFDGTLADTIADIAYAVNTGLKTMGFAEHDDDFYLRTVGHGLRNLAHDSLPQEIQDNPELSETMTDALYELLMDAYNQHPFDATEPYPFIMETLELLEHAGVRVAILSNKRTEILEQAVEAKFAGAHFDMVVGVSDTIPPKPNLKGAELILDKWHQEYGDDIELYYLGDTPIDMQVGLALKADTIAVSWGFRSAELLLAAGAPRIIDDARELPAALGLRKLRSFVVRQRKLNSVQERGFQEGAERLITREELLAHVENIAAHGRELVIEIGSGMGDATWRIAKNRPQYEYIALEVHKPGVGKLLCEAHDNKVDNLRVLCDDAMEILPMLPDGSLAGIHIFYPDPWPKKKHHKRRIVGTELLEKAHHKLKSGGYIYAVTDWEPYAEWMLEHIQAHGGYSGGEALCEPVAWRPQTRFQTKGEDAGRAPCEIWIEKK